MSYSNYQLNQRLNNLYSALTSVITGDSNIQLSTDVFTAGLNSSVLANSYITFPTLPSNPVPTFCGLNLVLRAGSPSGAFTVNGFDYRITNMPINAEWTLTIVNNSGFTGTFNTPITMRNQPAGDTTVYTFQIFTITTLPTARTGFITIYRTSLTSFIYRITTVLP